MYVAKKYNSAQKSLKGINYKAFYGCTSLTNVYYKGTASSWKKVQNYFNYKSTNACIYNANIHYVKGSSSKKAQTIKVKSGSLKKAYKAGKLKKSAQTFKIKSTAQGTVTYEKISGSKKIKIDKNGNVTVKKGTKKGTYTVTVNISAKATKKRYASSVRKTLTVKVK